MSKPTRMRVNVNTRAIPRAAGLISNTVILSANAYLLSSSIAQQFRDRRRERVSQTMEMGAQIANAVAGLTKVIVETIERGQASRNL